MEWFSKKRGFLQCVFLSFTALSGSFATEHLSSTCYGSSVRDLKYLQGGYYSSHVPAHTPCRPSCSAEDTHSPPLWREGCQDKFSGGLLGTRVSSAALQRCHTSKSHCKIQSSSHGFLWDSHHTMKRFFTTESTANPRKPFTAFEHSLKHFTAKVTTNMGEGKLGN